MKKITSGILLMITALGFSQNNPINFETGGNGAAWTWNTFENPSTPCAPLEIIANPDPSGANPSATVAKLTPLLGAPPYAGVESQHGTAIGTFTLSATNCTVKIMVWKSVLSDVGIKFATASGGSTGELKVANTVVNQWQELTFDFSGKIGEPTSTDIDQIVIFPDFQARSSDNVCYFDNITFSAQLTPPSDPVTAAPTPTRPEANVISMYSNAYNNVAVDTWRTDWSVATLTDLQIEGNDTKKYTALSFVGIETVGPNLIDASSMLYFHVDVWTPNMTTFRVKLVDFGADGAYAGGDDSEHELSFTPTLSGWNSYEIALSDFAGLTSKQHLAQLIFSGNPAGAGIAFIDNVYFHNVPFVNPNEPMTAAPTPTRPAANVISMFSNAYTNVPVDTWRTVWSAADLTDLQIAGNDTKKYTNLNFVGIETVGANEIDASGMTYFHVDAWTPNMTAFRIKLVDFGADTNFGGGDDVEHELSFTPTLSGWNSYDIPMADFAGLTTRNHIAQLIFSGNPSGAGTVFIDNVYFSNVALATETFGQAGVSIYPNPVRDVLTVDTKNTIDNISIYNMMGQQVISQNPNAASAKVTVSALQKGIYLVKVSAAGKLSTNRIIKN